MADRMNVAFEALCRKCHKMVKVSNKFKMECGHEMPRPKWMSDSQFKRYTQQHLLDEEDAKNINELVAYRMQGISA